MATLSVAKSEAMEPLHPICSSAVEERNLEKENTQVTDQLRFKRSVDELISKVDELEQKVNQVSEFYVSKRQGDIKVILDPKEKEKEKDKNGMNSNSNNNTNSSGNNCGTKKPIDGPRTHMVCSKRMQELMRQFGTILRQASLLDSHAGYTKYS